MLINLQMHIATRFSTLYHVQMQMTATFAA